MDFVPGGRIIFGSGRNSGGGGHNLLNCFVLIPEDNVESISKVLQDTYRISCAGGGIGFNASKIDWLLFGETNTFSFLNAFRQL